MFITSGTRLGRYEIRSALGAGGMGEVYLAEGTRPTRPVALKLLPARFVSDEERLRRFETEAQAAAKLTHPNVASIYEIGDEGGIHFIAMEYVEGETLRQRMGRIKLMVALDIAMQVAKALSAAHDARVVHRDIKPENIMLRPDGYVKVLDFGLAKLTEQEQDMSDPEALTKPLDHTDPGTIMGTAQYMSPEQAQGQKVDARTDIWSLGVVLYEMVAGRPPFSGLTKSHLIVSILEKEPPPIKAYVADAPEALEWIVAKALRKDREERYQTARELLSDLRSLKQQLEFAAEMERSVPPGSIGEAKPVNGGAQPSTVIPSVSNSTQPGAPAQTSVIESIKRHKTGVIFALALSAVAITAIILGLNYLRRSPPTSVHGGPFSQIKVARITNTGRASFAAISPDGKYIVHVMGDPGQQSVWLRHIATGSDKEIIPSTGINYCCPFFSHDGSYVYYSRPTSSVPSVVYKVPVLGGAPKTMLEDVDSQLALSPDGKRFAFIRGYLPEGKAALIVANADGTGEQKLATYGFVNFFVSGNTQAPAWSPDGETIVIRVPASGAGGGYQMLAVRVKDGEGKPVMAQSWPSLGQFGWLADGSGLIATADDQAPGLAQQIWHISYPGGEARRITNDLNDYRGISLTADSRALVTVQIERQANVLITSAGDASHATQITSNRYDGADGLAWTPDGQIVYTSIASGHKDIWIMNADGTGRKQLTADAGTNINPAVTPDGRYIVFASDRAGTWNIWRMNMDGGNPVQLTTGQSAQYPQCSPDSQWVFYGQLDSGVQRLVKVAIDGGNPVQLTDYTAGAPTVSPDGKQVACGYLDEQANLKRWILAIIPFDGGRPTKIFDVPVFRQVFRWSPDGRAIIYTDTHAGITNLWSQPVDGSPPRKLTDWKSDQIYWFDWSHDGKLVYSRGVVTSDVLMISDVR